MEEGREITHGRLWICLEIKTWLDVSGSRIKRNTKCEKIKIQRLVIKGLTQVEELIYNEFSHL